MTAPVKFFPPQCPQGLQARQNYRTVPVIQKLRIVPLNEGEGDQEREKLQFHVKLKTW